MTTEIIILALTMALFIGLGIIFHMGKGSFIIAGYNTMSKKEKEKHNIQRLSRFMGNLMFVIAFSTLLLFLGAIYNKKSLSYFATALNIIVPIVAIIYMNTSKSFKK